MNVYEAVMKLIAAEREKNGKPAIMKGRLISRLIQIIDAMLEYEGNEKK